MTFANTLTLTIDAVAKTLTRNNQDNFGSVYKYVSGTEKINMQIRHTTDKTGNLLHDRHNVFIEHWIYATPLAFEKYHSCTFTIRERQGSDPLDSLDLFVAASTLVATLDNGLVIGEN